MSAPTIHGMLTATIGMSLCLLACSCNNRNLTHDLLSQNNGIAVLWAYSSSEAGTYDVVSIDSEGWVRAIRLENNGEKGQISDVRLQNGNKSRISADVVGYAYYEIGFQLDPDEHARMIHCLDNNDAFTIPDAVDLRFMDGDSGHIGTAIGPNRRIVKYSNSSNERLAAVRDCLSLLIPPDTPERQINAPEATERQYKLLSAWELGYLIKED